MNKINQKKIRELKEIINESNNIVFFGGAGVSTASGLKDFRSKDGLYNEKNNLLNVSPEFMLSVSCFYSFTKEFYKYYKANTLTEDKIKVYVDDKLQASITKKLTQITDTATLKKLATKQGLADINNLKFTGYKLTLGNFGTINGVTKIVIDAGTIQDESGNKNIETTINVGNIEWIETGDSSTNQKYPAFRNSIVDFIKPVIKYKYSAVEGARNPDIDYEARTLTVKFTVTDKYLRESTIIKADGTLNTDAVKIKVAGTDLTTQLHTVITSADITDGKEYTLVISNF